MKIEKIIDTGFDQNTYFIIYESNECLIIDPGLNTEGILGFLKERNMKPRALLLTHYHFDHTASVDAICKEYDVKAYIHEDDYEYLIKPKLFHISSFDKDIEVSKKYVEVFTKESLKELDARLSFVNLKGHTKGSTLFFLKDNVFTGDVLFENSVGRCDLNGGDNNEMNQSIKWILENLKDNEWIHPGHGKSRVYEEVKKINPFLKKETITFE